MASRVSKNKRGQPELSRKAILDAASMEFAEKGLAGARTDAIAKAAGVNKALLYYYFRDKQSLYGAVLEYNLGSLLEELVRILDTGQPVGYRMLAYARTHFDYVAAHPEYRRLMQHEMMRAGNSKQFPRLVEVFFRPLMQHVLAVLEEGITNGEFRRVQPMQFMHSIIAVIVFYFTAVPVIRAMAAYDPLSPKALGQRREAMLDFIAGALFRDQTKAQRVVAEVLAGSSGRSQAVQSGTKSRSRGNKK